MGIPRVDADYDRQPYLWVLEYQTALQEIAQWDAIQAANKRAAQQDAAGGNQ